jgi:heme A synthase
MIYLLVLVPATALTIGGYFTLFLSGRSEGGMRAFGRYLGIWAFTLAVLLILGAIFAARHGGHQCPMWMHGMHSHSGAHDFGPPADEPPEAPAAPPAAPHG